MKVKLEVEINTIEEYKLLSKYIDKRGRISIAEECMEHGNVDFLDTVIQTSNFSTRDINDLCFYVKYIDDISVVEEIIDYFFLYTKG